MGNESNLGRDVSVVEIKQQIEDGKYDGLRKKYANKLRSCMDDPDERLSHIDFAMCEAVEKFRPGIAKFSTFLIHHLNLTILRRYSRPPRFERLTLRSTIEKPYVHKQALQHKELIQNLSNAARLVMGYIMVNDPKKTSKLVGSKRYTSIARKLGISCDAVASGVEELQEKVERYI